MGSEGALLFVMSSLKLIFYRRASPLLAITLAHQHPTNDFMYPRPWFQDNGNGIFALTKSEVRSSATNCSLSEPFNLSICRATHAPKNGMRLWTSETSTHFPPFPFGFQSIDI
jgi:hypothetical protein